MASGSAHRKAGGSKTVRSGGIAMTTEQTETGPIYNLIREERNIQAWGGTIGRTVRDGVVRIPLASINNPQFGEDEYWWYNAERC